MDGDDDLRNRVARGAERIPVPNRPAIEPVAERAGKLRTRRLIASGTVALLAVAGVAVPLILLSSIGSTRSHTPGATASPLPDVADIVCDGTSTVVLTPEVRPQRDGAHFRVDNRTGESLAFDIGTAGTSAEPGLHEIDGGKGWPEAPGTITVRCTDPQHDGGDRSGYVTLTLVDSDGIWIPDQLECPAGAGSFGGNTDYTNYDHGQMGQLLDLASEYLRRDIEPGDEVKQVGYPDAENPEVGVVRDGHLLVVAHYVRTRDGGWLPVGESGCSPLQSHSP